MQCLRAMLVCLLASTPAQAQTLSGRWCGVAEQTGPGAYRSEWSAVLDLKGATGRMAYPSLDCGGELTFERLDGNVHVYREHIDYGRNRCLDDGLVGIEPLGTSVRWEWNGSGARATGLLYSHCPEQSPNASNTLHRAAVAIDAN
jgi:hypothetical protein